ncbi:pentapeptide repeat-containing protein [Coleofasciculus sp. FACHB-1120]|uniref:pentapeptide repeat-containing protein n=1 Tax=Coleofasciculus sp. FACHB-1120 TaxID=2692783 RepID=UPI0016833037|nr:pentapeptide repeat-containing protein [Coleofasciculus sp. FACHB-1120]MBD2743478.1 pentapeptide repeat-containing protein [Coleofasciculus sp. FACHB-1120]
MWHKKSLWWILGGLGGSAIATFALLNFFRWHRLRTYEKIPDLRAVQWNGKNLAGTDFSRQIFREADLSEANLRRANLQWTDFSGAATRLIDTDLRQANLTNALLSGTQATRANFSGAILRQTDLSNASLNGARFRGADLQGAILIGAKLVGADFSEVKHDPAYLDRADLTDTGITGFRDTRLCNATMTNGAISKQGCFWPSYDLKQAAQAQDWRWMDSATSYLFKEAVIPGDAKALEQTVDEITPEQIREMPCKHLKTLDQLWRQASGDRFGFGIQRRIWESSPVNRDYTKFGEAVGWKQNGTWLKFNDLTAKESASKGSVLPIGHFPWHSWQVLEPTKTEPTRFRRVGFGEWMAHLKACKI